MRRKHERHLVPADVDIGMVRGFLGKFRHDIHKFYGGREILELKRAGDGGANFFPIGHGRERGLDLGCSELFHKHSSHTIDGIPSVLPSQLIRQRREEVANFIINFSGARDGVGDFRAEQFAVALAQAVDGDFHRAFTRAEVDGNLRVRHRATRLGERGFQLLKLLGLPVARVFLAQAPQHLVEQCERPTTFENPLGSHRTGGLKAEGAFLRRGINGDGNAPAAAFLRGGLVPFVGEEMFHRGEQEGTKPAFLAIHTRQKIFLEQARKKFLR